MDDESIDSRCIGVCMGRKINDGQADGWKDIDELKKRYWGR